MKWVYRKIGGEWVDNVDPFQLLMRFDGRERFSSRFPTEPEYLPEIHYK